MNIDNKSGLCEIDGISVQEIANDFARPALFIQRNQSLKALRKYKMFFATIREMFFILLKQIQI